MSSAHVVLEDRPLKILDPPADAAQGGQQLGVGRGMGPIQLGRRHANVPRR